jgi:hypothetical protein
MSRAPRPWSYPLLIDGCFGYSNRPFGRWPEGAPGREKGRLFGANSSAGKMHRKGSEGQYMRQPGSPTGSSPPPSSDRSRAR